jgi:protein-S-isoprenylcysteine O-methyltransferase Ste14
MKSPKGEFFIKRYRLEHLVPLALTILSCYFLVHDFQQNLMYLAGASINIIGLSIWWSAKITLAENWSPGYGQPKLKRLVTHGIYSKIRHPLYWGINMTLLGLLLLHRNIFLIVPSVIIIIYFFRRMYNEDKFLMKKLGNTYLKYKKKTWI